MGLGLKIHPKLKEASAAVLKDDPDKIKVCGDPVLEELMNTEFDYVPKIFGDSWKIMTLARWTQIHPITFLKGRFGRRLCPLTFYWTSKESFLAYVFFALMACFGTITAALNFTLSYSGTDVVGAFARGFCDTVLGIGLIFHSMKNTPKILRTMLRFAKYDNTAPEPSNMKALDWTRYIRIMGLLFITTTIWFAVQGFVAGQLTCNYDTAGIIKHFLKDCRAAMIIYSVFLALKSSAFAAHFFMYIYLVQAFIQRLLHARQYFTDIMEGPQTTINRRLEKLHGNFEDLRLILSDIIAANSPQLLLRFANGFLSALTMLYFAQLSVVAFSYKVALTLFTSAMVDLVVVFLFVNVSQAALDEIKATEDQIESKLTATRFHDTPPINHTFNSCFSKMREAMTASDYFYLNKRAFLGFLNAIATYLVIMLQFNLANGELYDRNSAKTNSTAN